MKQNAEEFIPSDSLTQRVAGLGQAKLEILRHDGPNKHAVAADLQQLIEALLAQAGRGDAARVR